MIFIIIITDIIDHIIYIIVIVTLISRSNNIYKIKSKHIQIKNKKKDIHKLPPIDPIKVWFQMLTDLDILPDCNLPYCDFFASTSPAIIN